MRPTVLTTNNQRIEGDEQLVLVPQPAAGKEWSYTLPSGHRYKVLLGYAECTSVSASSNLQPGFAIRTADGQRLWISWTPGTAAGTELHIIAWSTTASAPSPSLTFNRQLTVPDVWLPGGWEVGSFTTALEPTDQYQNIRMYLQRAFDRRPGEAAGELPHSAPDWITLGVNGAT